MKFRLSNPPSAIRHPRSLRAFTMVEIALSLAIIGFALVAIIGVLPAGMSVQKDNREQTVINLDAAYLMDAIRSGPLGQDDLTNYIISITQTRTPYQGPQLLPSGTVTFTFTTNLTATELGVSGPCLTNGFNIVGLLSTPKYAYTNRPPPAGLILWSNTVTAVFRAINAPAVDQGASQVSKDFAFQYQVTIEIVPSADYPRLGTFTPGWVNLTAPAVINVPGVSPGDETRAKFFQDNLYEIRLTFRWPVLPNGQLGGGKQIFRSSVAGTYLTGSPPLPPQPTLPQLPSGQTVPNPMGQSLVLPNWAYLFFMRGNTYTAQTP